MSDDPTIRDQLAKLSPSDREKYNHDMVAYGSAMLQEMADGTVVYVPKPDWPAQLRKLARAEGQMISTAGFDLFADHVAECEKREGKRN